MLDRAVIEAERERLNEEAFEQEYGAVFIGELKEPCEECGYPDHTITGMVVIQGDYAFPLCATCGKETDEKGHTLWTRWPDGSPHLQVIELVFRAPEFLSEGCPDPDDPVQMEEIDVEAGLDEPRMRSAGEFFGLRPGATT
jgi:hypothetical protein